MALLLPKSNSITVIPMERSHLGTNHLLLFVWKVNPIEPQNLNTNWESVFSSIGWIISLLLWFVLTLDQLIRMMIMIDQLIMMIIIIIDQLIMMIIIIIDQLHLDSVTRQRSWSSLIYWFGIYILSIEHQNNTKYTKKSHSVQDK